MMTWRYGRCALIQVDFATALNHIEPLTHPWVTLHYPWLRFQEHGLCPSALDSAWFGSAGGSLGNDCIRTLPHFSTGSERLVGDSKRQGDCVWNLLLNLFVKLIEKAFWNLFGLDSDWLRGPDSCDSCDWRGQQAAEAGTNIAGP